MIPLSAFDSNHYDKKANISMVPVRRKLLISITDNHPKHGKKCVPVLRNIVYKNIYLIFPLLPRPIALSFVEKSHSILGF